MGKSDEGGIRCVFEGGLFVHMYFWDQKQFIMQTAVKIADKEQVIRCLWLSVRVCLQNEENSTFAFWTLVLNIPDLSASFLKCLV